MSAPLKVKAIWLKDGVEEGLKEVRRFRVSDESGAGGTGSQRLPNVLHNVHSLFNVTTATQYCTLYWKDEDDDLIQFSSEEELSHAIDSMSDDTLRIYVIITGEGPSAPSCEGKYTDCNCSPQKSSTSSSSFSSSSSSSSSFQAPPPPPPPHQEPHSHCPPPPFPGPWAHQGWKKWKPMGPGGWKGGWKGGMYFGCPWNMRHGMQGCGHKGRGLFKHGWDKKQKKWMKAKRCWMTGSANDQKEYDEVLQQVPSEFRSWVRQYLQTWYTEGPEAARAAAPEKLPQNVGEDFPQWLHTCLTRFFPHPCVWGEGEAKDGAEGEMGKAPSCLPPVYFRWLAVYVPCFFQRNGHFSFSSSSDGEEDDGSWQWQFQGHGFCPKGFGWKGKHGGCKKMRGGKHKQRMSCGSDDNDGNGNCEGKVPKQFRKFVRVSFKKLRKGKAENPKIKAKATRAGISAEVQECVEQILLEWQAKLSLKNFRTVSKEMIRSDRTLPPGMPRMHFLWMLRYMLHWEERRSGKHNAMHSCPSDESSSDDTSGEESAPEEQDCGPCPPPPPPFHPPFMGMMGVGPHSFAIPMPSGMEHPFPPPPPPPAMFGCFPPPPPPPGCYPMNPPPYMFSCQGEDMSNRKAPSSEEMVDQVTEGVKKL